jgi:hypothetical protein
MRANGDTVLSLVVLKEILEEPTGDYPSPEFFVLRHLVQYRVLRLNEQGQYEVSLWREQPQVSRGSRPAIDFFAAWVPTRNGQPLPFIPFVFDPLLRKSLLEALVEVNYQFYRHSADYEHALHLTARPTPYVTGYTSEATDLEIGGSVAWLIPEPTARVGMLEFLGAGLTPHEHALDADIKAMAGFGARLIEGQPLVPETATATLRRTEGAESPMQSLISDVSQRMTQALRWHAWWGGFTNDPADPAIRVDVNKDMLASPLEPTMLQQLVTTWLSGGMSFQTLYANLHRGELTRPGIVAEDEQTLIALEQAARADAFEVGRG